MPKLLGGTSPLKMLLWVDIWLISRRCAIGLGGMGGKKGLAGNAWRSTDSISCFPRVTDPRSQPHTALSAETEQKTRDGSRGFHNSLFDDSFCVP